MTGLGSLINRNCKLFFKDKGMFFSALITPIILLVLYMTFLSGVFEDSFYMALPQGMPIDDKIIKGTVAGQLVASLLSVCAVTVAFCSNMLMVQDKVNKASLDLTLTPVKKSTMALAYYLASLISTLIITYLAMVAGLIYIAIEGWYMSFSDVALLALDVFLLTMFGTALSSIINVFLSTQGQISAVGTIISAGYGFICGAYMPMSSFGEGLQKALSFLPGTYGTSLVKNHTLAGVFREMENSGFPLEVVDGIKSSLDCNLKFFDNAVAQPTMYAILVGAVALLLGGFILLNFVKKKQK